MTPPAIAPAFTLLPFEGEGVGVTDAFEGPMTEPGPNSGESIKILGVRP